MFRPSSPSGKRRRGVADLAWWHYPLLLGLAFALSGPANWVAQAVVLTLAYGWSAYAAGLHLVGKGRQLSDGQMLPGGWGMLLELIGFALWGAALIAAGSLLATLTGRWRRRRLRRRVQQG